MNLPDLLTQITPLPWTDRNCPPMNRVYQMHCANLFPELVQALEDLNCWLIDPDGPDTRPEILAEMKIKYAHALARANEIKI